MLNVIAVPIAMALKDEIESSVTIDMASIKDKMPSFEVASTIRTILTRQCLLRCAVLKMILTSQCQLLWR
jgi:hypothetical protein